MRGELSIRLLAARSSNGEPGRRRAIKNANGNSGTHDYDYDDYGNLAIDLNKGSAKWHLIRS